MVIRAEARRRAESRCYTKRKENEAEGGIKIDYNRDVLQVVRTTLEIVEYIPWRTAALP